MISAINSTLQSQQRFQPIKRDNSNPPNKSKSNVSFGIVPYSPEFYGVIIAASVLLCSAVITGIHYLAKK